MNYLIQNKTKYKSIMKTSLLWSRIIKMMYETASMTKVENPFMFILKFQCVSYGLKEYHKSQPCFLSAVCLLKNLIQYVLLILCLE